MSDAELSNVSVNGKRLTWRELVEHREVEMSKLREKASLFDDLDRCEHGRHKGDACTLTEGCGGPSHGNPLALPDGTIGYGLSGVPIVHPFLAREEPHP